MKYIIGQKCELLVSDYMREGDISTKNMKSVRPLQGNPAPMKAGIYTAISFIIHKDQVKRVLLPHANGLKFPGAFEPEELEKMIRKEMLKVLEECS